MKKILLSLFAGTMLFSGCSFFENDEPEIESSMETAVAEQKSTGSDQEKEELFFELAQANADYMVKKIEENVPSVDLLKKNTTNVSFSGEVNLDQVPQISGGTLVFDIHSDVKKDAQNSEELKVVQDISFSAEVKDSSMPGKAQGKAVIQVVDKGIYASLQSLTVDSAQVPEGMVEGMLGKYINKWYGNTFAELTALTNGEMDVEKLMTSKGFVIVALEIMKDEQENLKEYMDFVSVNTEVQNKEEGVYYFNVKVNKEKTKEASLQLFERLGSSQEYTGEMEDALEKSIEDTFVVGLKPSDTSYIEFITPARDIETKNLIEGKDNTIIYSVSKTFIQIYSSENDYIMLDAKDDKFVISGEIKGKMQEVMTGTYSSDEFMFEAINPDNTKEMVSGEFEKNDEKWSGEVKNSEIDNIVVKITDAFWEKESLAATIMLEMKEGKELKTLGKATFTAEIESVSSVDAKKPSPVESAIDTINTFRSIKGDEEIASENTKEDHPLEESDEFGSLEMQ